MAFPMFGTYSYALVGKVIPVRYETVAIAVLITGSNLGSFIVPIGIHYLGEFMNANFTLVAIIRHAFILMSVISFPNLHIAPSGLL
ncbi:MAG: MFS transporter [Acetilactobacillus jinshanensis]